MHSTTLILVALALAGAVGCAVASPDELYAIRMTETLSGGQEREVAVGKYRGKVLLVANLASYCGFTQAGYEHLSSLHHELHRRGLQILGFPCNQFGRQEPGTAQEILDFAQTRGASFPMFAKTDVNGANEHPLFTFLKRESGNPADIEWNFAYFLVNRSGTKVVRFKAGTNLQSEEVRSMIDSMLDEPVPKAGPPRPRPTKRQEL